LIRLGALDSVFSMPPQRRRPDLSLPKGKKQKTTSKPESMMERLKALYKTQWENERNRAANKSLLKALGMFVGGVIVFRSAGEALFA